MGGSRNGPSVGDVLPAIVQAAAAEVEDTAAPALADEPDAVHQHRVRVRRLRSVLAGFEEELDARAAQRLRVAYAQWGDELGVVRDAEVRALVAEEALSAAAIDDAAVLQRLVGSEREDYPRVHARLVELARSPRAEERERELRAFAADVPVVEPDRAAVPVLADVLQAQARRVKKAHRRLDGTDERYHDLRKAARRAKYVAEAVAEAVPGILTHEVQALADAGDDLHDALGAHRDGMLLAHRARREGVLAGRAGEPSDAYQRVAQRAQDAAEEQLADVPKALRRLEDAASDLP